MNLLQLIALVLIPAPSKPIKRSATLAHVHRLEILYFLLRSSDFPYSRTFLTK
jgi:hypothetical protein